MKALDLLKKLAIFLFALAVSSVSFTPANAAATPSAKTCKASIEKVAPAKYFGAILAQVRKEWDKTAVISSVRFEDRVAKNFDSLCDLQLNSNWRIVFYSLSKKIEEYIDINTALKSSTSLPAYYYNAMKVAAGGTTYTEITLADMKKQGGWTFSTFSRPETFAYESKKPDNPFTGWKMSLGQVVQKMLDRVKAEQITGMGYYITIGKASTKTKTPYADVYWQSGVKKVGQAYYVEPVSLKTYITKY